MSAAGVSIATALLGMATNSGFLIATSCASGLALLIALARMKPANVSVSLNVEPARIFEDQEAEVSVELTNESSTTMFIEIAAELPSLLRVRENANVATVGIDGRGKARYQFPLEAPVKGHYVLMGVTVRRHDEFGLVVAEARHEHTARVRVLPRKEDLRKAPVRTRYPLIFLGGQVVRAPGQGTEFFGLRDYSPGDPLKEVNWKASARSKSLIVNQRERETVANVTIFLDSRDVAATGRADDNAALWGARATATLSAFFLQRRDRVRLVTYGETVRVVEPDGGERQLHRILDTLSELEPAGALPSLEAIHKLFPRLQRKSPVVIISSLVDDASVVEAASLLLAHEMSVLVIAVEPRAGASEDARQALLRLERRLAIMDLRASGVGVAAWDGGRSIDRALTETVIR